MAIFELHPEKITPVAETRFTDEGVTERGDLQRLLRDRIEVIAPDTMVIAEEFGEWDESRRRIDLLALDKHANIVVIELKRNQEGGHMELQAIRYAAMVSAMTFDQVVAAHSAYLTKRDIENDARQTILDFLEWDEPNEDDLGQTIRIVLVSADFSKELTTSVMWLNEHDLDICCVRIKPYSLDGRVLLDVQQVIPLPEATEYQVQVREKTRRERQDRESHRDLTKYDVAINGHTFSQLPKRKAVLNVVMGLCAQGVTPEQIQETLAWRGTRLWRSVNGDVSAEQFLAQASAAAAQGGPAFDPKRWFRDEASLIRSEGRTYAFSKMWGTETEQALQDLSGAYPSHSISYGPSDHT